jgi:dihydroorotase-like cyclic amidohydrolase
VDGGEPSTHPLPCQRAGLRPRRAAATRDLGITDGRFTRVEPVIDAALAREVFDARGQLGFPGAVDAHTHVGIYAPL